MYTHMYTHMYTRMYTHIHTCTQSCDLIQCLAELNQSGDGEIEFARIAVVIRIALSVCCSLGDWGVT